MCPFSVPTTATPAAEEHVVLCRAYGAVQERCSRVMAQQQADIERLQAEVVRLRAAVVVRDTLLMQVREQQPEPTGRAVTPAEQRGWAARLRAGPWRALWTRSAAPSPIAQAAARGWPPEQPRTRFSELF